MYNLLQLNEAFVTNSDEALKQKLGTHLTIPRHKPVKPLYTRIETADETQLPAWLEQILSAKKLEDIF